jgi:hypothetical protein
MGKYNDANQTDAKALNLRLMVSALEELEKRVEKLENGLNRHVEVLHKSRVGKKA